MQSIRFIACAALLMLTACAGSTGQPLDVAESSWHLVDADRGLLATHAADSRITLEFGAGQVTGHGGCNRYSGSYVLDGETLKIGPLASTKMGCVGVASELEAAWHALLSTPLRIKRVGSQLQLQAADGTTLGFDAGPVTGP